MNNIEEELILLKCKIAELERKHKDVLADIKLNIQMVEINNDTHLEVILRSYTKDIYGNNFISNQHFAVFNLDEYLRTCPYFKEMITTWENVNNIK